MADEEKRNLSVNDLEKILGLEVAKVETRMLTAPGDNYGSIMLAVDATLKSGNVLALVAKMFPISEMVQNVFQSPTSMKKEIDVYRIISPEYQKIQEEQNVPPSQRLHIFCKCPGARLTLEDNDDVELADENSVLLLENLKLQGYRTGDRTTGLDLKHTEYVLKHLARFHATTIAIKMKKPLVFRNKLLKVLTPFKIVVGSKEEKEKQTEAFIDSLKTIPACNRKIDALIKLFNEDTEFTFSDNHRPIREPFATFMHNDFWTNNMMFKYKSDIDEDPEDVKFLDFQTSHYGSPVSDILLFLFTSTQTGILTGRFDYFLELYHSTFVEWLEKLGCETTKFSLQSFIKEVNIVASLSLNQIIFMLFPITFTKEQVDKFDKEVGPGDGPPELNNMYVLKVSEAVNIYAEKEWL